ncbi:MAG: multiheme c-type cytochrome, partial [Thermodesulfovibrionales bacterium]
MKHRNRLPFLAALILLIIPLSLALNAGAASTVLPNVNIWFGSNSINDNGGWRIDDPSCIGNPAAEMLDECRRIMLASYPDQATCQTQICADGTAKTAAQCNAAGFSMVNQGTWQNICSDLNYGTQIACQATPGNFSWTNPFCSDPQYTTQTTCTTNAGAWTVGVCSNPLYTSATTCTTAYLASGNTWFLGGCSNPSYTTASTCTINTWDGTTCSNPVYTTQPTCSLATWNGTTCSNPVYSTAGSCTTGAALSNNTWDPTPHCSNPSYTDSISCTTVATGRTWTPACTATWADGSSVTAGFYGTLALCSNPAYTDVTSCTSNSGDWQQLWSGSYNGGCQRCHDYASRGNNSGTENGISFPMNGHKNALRRVTPGIPLGGAAWTSSQSTVPAAANLSGVTAITYEFPDVAGAAPYTTDLSSAEYIVGGWYKAVKKAQISRTPVTGNEPVIMTGDACAECHATGYVGKWGVGVGRNGLSSGGNKWLYDGVQCALCHSSAPVPFSSSNTTPMDNGITLPVNQTATQLCTYCHQQRVGGVAGTVQPAQLAVDSVTGAFVGYPIGNQFLNSPHSRFSGTAGGIG